MHAKSKAYTIEKDAAILTHTRRFLVEVCKLARDNDERQSKG